MEDVRNVNLKIKRVLKEIDDFKSWHGKEEFSQSDMKNLLKEIVKILEVPGSKDDFTAGFVD